jgi:hypothetical protein
MLFLLYVTSFYFICLFHKLSIYDIFYFYLFYNLYTTFGLDQVPVSQYIRDENLILERIINQIN